MALWRRPVGVGVVIALLLLVVFLFNLASASSGGVMGGSFFHSDSSSSSDSFTSDDSERVRELHKSPSPDADLERGNHGGVPLFFMIFIFGLFLVGFCKDTNGNTITVLKLQVALFGGMGSSIQRDLTRIAEVADTSSPEGVSNLLTETILTLARHPGSCIAGYSSVDLKRGKEDGEKCYNQLSNEERAKFDEETLVNLNNTDKRSTRIQSVNVFSNEYKKFDVKEAAEDMQKFEKHKLLNGFSNEYIVITILVTAKGAHKLPKNNGAEDLKKALQNLRLLLPSKLLAGEVLWTPQKEDDTLSEQKLLEDYPQLAECIKSSLFKKQE